MVRLSHYELVCLSSPGGAAALHAACEGLGGGGGSGGGGSTAPVALLEAADPGGLPGRAFVKARPAGEPFALAVTNHSQADVSAEVMVDGKACRVHSKTIKPGRTRFFYGWQLDASVSEAWGPSVKPFEFRAMEQSDDGSASVGADAACFAVSIRESFRVPPHRRKVSQRTALNRMVVGGAEALREGSKAAKVITVTANAPSAQEVSQSWTMRRPVREMRYQNTDAQRILPTLR